jgi:hypothetical protein
MTTSAAELIAIDAPYHDGLVVTNFGLTVPDGATIAGIQFDVRRNADGSEGIDSTVRVLQNGAPVGTDHAQMGAWPTTLTYVTYGGATDTWGAAWTAADVRATGFGISIAPQYTATKGNDRLHIDSVRATVFYSGHCE